MGTPSQALDYDTDMQTIRDYVQSVVETQAKLATSYTSALDNFQTTVLTASPADAKPDVLGAILKSSSQSRNLRYRPSRTRPGPILGR